MNTIEVNKVKTEGIINRDLRTYKQVSLKGFAKLSDKEKSIVVNEIYLQLKRSESGDDFVLDPALDKLEFMGLFLLPNRTIDQEEALKEDRARLNNLHIVSRWSNFEETKWMIIENYDELYEMEKRKGFEERNDILVHWLSDKLATLVKNEIIERLEKLEI